MNPITEARMSAALSKQEFSRRLRLSRTFILRAEEGCYSNPGSKLIQFSTNELKISIGEFNRRYAKFQRDTRIRRTENIEPLQIVNRIPSQAIPVGLVQGIYEVDLEINSDDIKTVQLNEEFKKWRESYWTSYVGFCQALCVHPASVENYEEGLYDFMPRLIVDALSEVSLLDSSFNPDLKWVYVYA